MFEISFSWSKVKTQKNSGNQIIISWQMNYKIAELLAIETNLFKIHLTLKLLNIEKNGICSAMSPEKLPKIVVIDLQATPVLVKLQSV